MGWSLSFLYVDWVYKVTCMFKITWNNSLPKIRMCPKLFSEETCHGSISRKWPTTISDHHIFKSWLVTGCSGGIPASVLFNKKWHTCKINFIYKPQVKQQPQGCDQTEQQNVRLYPLYHSLGKKKCTCNLSSLKPPIYTFFFLRHGGIYFWVLHVNKTINEIMTSTCYIIKLWLMWSTLLS